MNKDINYIIDSLPMCYAYYKIILDELGNPVDFLFLDVNKKFEDLRGLNKSEIIGKKATEIFSEMVVDERELIETCGDIALNGGSKVCEKYFDKLKRWYRINVYSSKKYYFITYLMDIDVEMQVAITSQEFLEQTDPKIDYQKITDKLLDISGAKYIAFNLFEENGLDFRTVALSGINEHIKKASSLLGFKIIGKKWRHDPYRLEKIKDNIITIFPSLHELTNEVLPKNVVIFLEKTFFTGQVIVIKIIKDNLMIGYFTLIMPLSHPLQNKRFLEIYTRQVGLLLNQKRYEERLRSSERNFRLFFETIDDMIIIGNKKGEIFYTNKAVEKKLGYTDAELANMHILDVHPDDKINEAEHIFADMFAGKRDMCPLPLARKDGGLVPVETRVWFGEWDGKECVFGISKDLSKEQEALQKFNKFFDSNPALMAVSTLPGSGRKFVEVNRAFLNKMGYKKDEIIGKTSGDLKIFAEEEKQKKISDSLVEKDFIHNCELKVRTKKGNILDGLFSGEIIESQGKKYFLTVMTDITAQKLASIKLEKSNQRLEKAIAWANELAASAEKANEMKSEFLANMSHEIRTPLNVIMGFAEILENELIDDRLRNYLVSIKTAGNSLLNLINDVLDMSKIEAGMMEIHFDYFDLNELLKGMELLFYRKIKDKGLKFILNKEDIPAQIKLDKHRLRQILINLIGNAIKFTEKGFIKVLAFANLDFSRDNKRLNLEIDIEDTGIGIIKEKQKEIFDAFVQQNSQSSRNYGGSGLGLAISKKLSELMNGSIEVESDVGEGSVFKVIFKGLEYNDDLLIKEEREEDFTDYDFSGSSILVIDDVKFNRELIGLMLGDKGINIRGAESGREGIDLSEEHNFDLILMDLKMPGIDGYEALKEIRQIAGNDNLPVIALTAAATDDEKLKSESAGFTEFLSKPVSKNKLLKILAKYLPNRQKEESIYKDSKGFEEFNGELKLPEKSKAEIMMILKKEFLPRINAFRGAIVINEVEEFIFDLKEFAKEYQIDSFIGFSAKLEKDLNGFEMKELEKSLLYLSNFINKI